jgi:hypothetical protein
MATDRTYPHTDDHVMRGVLHANRRRRTHNWKTSADYYHPDRIRGASDEFVAWARANIPQRQAR